MILFLFPIAYRKRKKLVLFLLPFAIQKKKFNFGTTKMSNSNNNEVTYFTDNVQLLGVMGDDLFVTNAARVSYDGSRSKFGEGDKKLMATLVREGHTSPFRHPHMSFRITTTRGVADQVWKHVVGSEMHEKDTGFNQQSQRYKEPSQFRWIQEWRLQSSTNKQCSEGVIEKGSELHKVNDAIYHNAIETCMSAYKTLRANGVARELAREVLPMATGTRIIWTASLQTLLHFIRLRDAPDSQPEVANLARLVAVHVKQSFPVSYEFFEETGRSKF